CARYGFMETLETVILSTIAEIFMALRVYAVTKKHKAILVFAAAIILWQWGIAVEPPLPTLPDIDPFHSTCFFSSEPWVEAFLCISLAFDIVVFLIITIGTTQAIRNTHIKRMLRVIQQDGIIYFFVMFSSNLVWLLLVLHARVSSLISMTILP
ncbi:hypothetical protein DENSPDRAFT_787417, partial [Dentipellis sp. KUC8613]